MILIRGTLILIAAIVAMSPARAGDDLPRYRLEPGMELVYKGSDKFKYQNGSFLNDEELTAWVVRKNEDGSVRVVIRQGSRFQQIRGESSVKESVKSLFKKPEPMDYEVGYFDIFPDGRLGADSELGYRIDSAILFPRLPDDAPQSQNHWGQRDEKMAKEYEYSAMKPEAGGWVFRADRLGPEKKIYGMTHESIYHFSADRGAVQRIEQTATQDYGFKGTGSGQVELVGVEKKDQAWLAAFNPSADRYFAANKTYDRLTAEASKDAEKSITLLTEAKATLQTARDAIELPIFREQLDRQIKKHDGMTSYYAESARKRASVVGNPAADWSLEGLDGKTHALADYRGKVVVLDFWYRGCGWCIKAMPQMNQLAEQFEGKPVAILGMNTDSEVADAKFVVEAMGLKYETLRAKGIPEKYGVQGFPTLILIDAEGKVHDVHVGYSATLRADVAKEIDGLLSGASK